MSTRSDSGPGTDAPGEVSAAIERWLTDAIITAEQATQMRADLPELPPGGAHGGSTATPPRTSRAALVTEALGYLGGAGEDPS